MSVSILRRVGLALLLIGFLCGSSCEHTPPPPPPVQTPLVEWNELTPAACAGGGAAAVNSMSPQGQTLANLIAGNFFISGNLGAINTTNLGVAQWHANDMAQRGVVSLIGSDGEDALNRIACSSGGALATETGVIAVGVSTDPHDIWSALQNDASATQMMSFFGNNGSSISVGYENGYWMIIFQ